MKVELPASISERFSTCENADGSTSMRTSPEIYAEEILDFDWQISRNMDLTVESYSPFGQTVFQLNFNSEKSQFTDSLQNASLEESISVDDKGYLVFRGFRIALKIEEILCFLQYKLPKKWLEKVTHGKVDHQKIKLGFQEDFRSWIIKGDLSPENTVKWNGAISWKYLWGLKKQTLNFKIEGNSNFFLSVENEPNFWIRFSRKED